MTRLLSMLFISAAFSAPAAAETVADITAAPGFLVERLYEPDAATEGSWVAMCAGPDGLLFVADQYGSIFEVLPAPIGDGVANTNVKRINVDVSGAQGLCWAFDSLYAMVHGTGLIRITDEDGDGELDRKTTIVPLDGAGEHGPHAVRQDGDSLLIICGNHTKPPALTASRFAVPAQEDLLLPREPDPRGHAVGVMAPGGYLCRVAPDGSTVEFLAAGMRNSYDFDVNAAGDVFTFDSDMEWDLGLPWYKPTRILHLVSGADFGWRHGSGKWPAYYADSLPAVVDIGPASPTGVLFGTGAAFPTRYQSALFALDWTFGIMYAVHLRADGASYTADVEHFLTGKPLPLTDAVIGDDGAMYFTTGGRRIASALYRVTYIGDESTAAPKPARAAPDADLRRMLESAHRADAATASFDRIWPGLGADDRFVRHAARTALEHQGADAIRADLDEYDDPAVQLGALTALARVGDPQDADAVITQLAALDGLSPDREIDRLRAFALVMTRLGEPSADARQAMLDRIAAVATADDMQLGTEVVRLLVALDDPRAIGLGLRLIERHPGTPAPDWADIARRNDQYGAAVKGLLDRPPPSDQLRIAFMLRTLDEGWTDEQRADYFAFLYRAAASSGGMSYQGYIDRIRARAAESCTDAQRAALGPLLSPPPRDDTATMVVPYGPGRSWTVRRALNEVRDNLKNRNYIRGEGLYRAGICIHCHQFNGAGGNAGPDLSSVGSTYELEDLLRAIIEPSHAVTDQYALTNITLKDGRTVTGLVVESTNDVVRVATDYVNIDQTIELDPNDITRMTTSSMSPMPAGLLNAFGPTDLSDLMAYLLSGGDPNDPMFRR